MDIEKEPQPPVEVPLDALGEDTVRAIIESFILREGTDYGREEVGFETKVTQVMDLARQNQHPLQCTIEKE